MNEPHGPPFTLRKCRFVLLTYKWQCRVFWGPAGPHFPPLVPYYGSLGCSSVSLQDKAKSMGLHMSLQTCVSFSFKQISRSMIAGSMKNRNIPRYHKRLCQCILLPRVEEAAYFRRLPVSLQPYLHWVLPVGRNVKSTLLEVSRSASPMLPWFFGFYTGVPSLERMVQTDIGQPTSCFAKDQKKKKKKSRLKQIYYLQNIVPPMVL